MATFVQIIDIYINFIQRDASALFVNVTLKLKKVLDEVYLCIFIPDFVRFALLSFWC